MSDEQGTPLERLVALLELERIEQNLFRGESLDIGAGHVFGGQVLGQALAAAAQTVDQDWPVHSLHAYFLRPGDVRRPIVYAVDRIRDGSSFVTRRVEAIQHGAAIFHLSCSFQRVEEGLQHQEPMPEAPPPESLANEEELLARFAHRFPPMLRGYLLAARPIEVRPVDPPDDLVAPQQRPPLQMSWLRAAGRLPDEPRIHRALLAWASDHGFVTTALRPHGVTWFTPGMQVASLDHAMWFHAPCRADEWLLYVADSPVAGGARGFARGRLYSRDGRLVASTAQEGLIRQRTKVP